MTSLPTVSPAARALRALALAVGVLASFSSPPARAQESARAQQPGRAGSGRAWWRAGMSVGTIVNMSGWDSTTIRTTNGTTGTTTERTFEGTSGFASGAYAAGYAGLDEHFQVGGFISYTGLPATAAESATGETFYRAMNIIGLGASAKGGGRVHDVVWLGAALDVGLAIVLPRNIGLGDAGGRVELGDWYGLFLFPRLHVDIVGSGRRDVGVGFFWDFGPLLLPVAQGEGSGGGGTASMEFSAWTICLQMVMGFSFGA